MLSAAGMEPKAMALVRHLTEQSGDIGEQSVFYKQFMGRMSVVLLRYASIMADKQRGRVFSVGPRG